MNYAIPDEVTVERNDFYYNFIPSRSVFLFKGRRELYFQLDPKHKQAVDALLIRLTNEMDKTSSMDDKDILGKMIKDVKRLRRLLVKLPNQPDMVDTADTIACDYKLDRFFYGLDGIKFEDTEDKRTKRANTRGQSDKFHAELMALELKYEACLPVTQIIFTDYDSKRTRRDCGNEHWLKLTELVTKLVTKTPPLTEDDNILAHRLVMKTVWAMPSLPDVEDIFASKLILEYPHVVQKDFEELITLRDAGMMDTQLLVTALPFLRPFEALFLARARRRQIQKKKDIQKVVWYLEGLEKIEKDFPRLDWTHKLYECDVRKEIPEGEREDYFLRNRILEDDITAYRRYCCTNRHEYTCPDRNTFAQFSHDVTGLRDTVMLSYIAEERERQKQRKREDIWPEIAQRKEKESKEELIQVGRNLFQSTPVNPSRPKAETQWI